VQAGCLHLEVRTWSSSSRERFAQFQPLYMLAITIRGGTINMLN